MSLPSDVRKFIQKEELFLDTATLLCAVSGGRDSMVMIDLLRTLGYKIEVAHINYMLRGDESIQDEALVAKYSAVHNLTLHTKALSSKEVEHLQEGNLQKKARDLRYTWFNDLISNSKIKHVCIGHHKGDVAETFLLHALRGAGSNGLRSIQHSAGYIRRPLLNSHPKDIEKYASDNNVIYRHDQSNFSDKYDRNFIRNHTINSLQKRWPSTIDKLADASANVSNELNLLNHFVNQEKLKWISKGGLETKLGPISHLSNHKHSNTLSYHMINEFGFNHDTVVHMLSSTSTQGAIFYSESHIACIHDDHILIRKKFERSTDVITISSPQEVNHAVGSLNISKVDTLPAKKASHVEWIKLDSSKWPMTLRTWKEGDKIKPLGMGGKSKKVSDILIDQKASFFEKEDQLVLLDKSDEIIWLVGRKLSESVKYNSETKEYLKLEYIPLA